MGDGEKVEVKYHELTREEVLAIQFDQDKRPYTDPRWDILCSIGDLTRVPEPPRNKA